MKRLTLLAMLLSGLLLGLAGSVAQAETPTTKKFDAGTVEISRCGPNVLRVRIAKDLGGFKPSLAVINQEVKAATAGKLTAALGDDGSITFRADGKAVLTTAPLSAQTLTAGKDPVDESTVYALRYAFRLSKDEAIYGFGQFPDGVMNWRGHSVELAQRNITAAVPMFLSTAGYGVLWDNSSYTEFEDKADGLHVASELGDGVAFYMIYGPSFDEIISAYRQLTGAAPMFPRWAMGYWQCKERYTSFAELIDVVAEYRKRKLPLDVIIQDWQYWGKYGWSAMKFDETVGTDRKTHIPTGYPNAAENIAEIHKLHAHMMISIWPCLGHNTDIYKDLKAKDYILIEKMAKKTESSFYDAYNPAARAMYWEYAKQGLFDYGIDAWWLDGLEPELGRQTPKGIKEQDKKLKAAKSHLGSGKRYFLSYPLAHSQGMYENQRKTTSDKRVCLLTRAAFLGQQRYASVTWSGDISASWDVFKQQIPAGLNFSPTGIPYWTTDTGAFFVGKGGSKEFQGGCTNEAYRQFYTRWFQFSTFCPILRAAWNQNASRDLAIRRARPEVLRHAREVRRASLPHAAVQLLRRPPRHRRWLHDPPGAGVRLPHRRQDPRHRRPVHVRPGLHGLPRDRPQRLRAERLSPGRHHVV